MARAITLATKVPYQLERERGKPGATTFYGRTPTAVQMASFLDIRRSGASGAAALYILRDCLTGWENYEGPDGGPVVFGPKPEGGASEDSINRIPQVDRFELAAWLAELGDAPVPFSSPSGSPPG